MGWKLKRKLNPKELLYLKSFGWRQAAGNRKRVWIRACRQRLLLIKRDCIIRSYRCSTAKAGLGNQKDSRCTPLGWHEIVEKIGSGLVPGAIFKFRKWTGEIWRPGEKSKQDLILSRILWLEGLKQGFNRGGKVDTQQRLIYIHGTNAQESLGKPASEGCVRLSNKDMIELFDLLQIKDRLLITPG